ncbi:BrnA antitoxin family protein [Thiocapsa sp.]|uniref:BrnA antitoxin family protein n=1 Tax=Thiocapsa sp. TaxID=2024551 RepID=UPI002CB93487|nr:BrnA antitoxin family protein [Thiocapsa sp.]HSO83244.1 BrnA antitoxin family protein [Thiocapsa sp.]
MKKTYDFSSGKRGAVVPAPPGRTEIMLHLDDEVIAWFRRQVTDAGGGDYQALINAALREHIQRRSGDLLEDTLRKVIREERRAAS